jgi:hypothetical protein
MGFGSSMLAVEGARRVQKGLELEKSKNSLGCKADLMTPWPPTRQDHEEQAA